MRARLSTDGGARGNPGPAAFAYVTREPTGKEIACYGPFVGRDQLTAAAKRLRKVR